MLERLETSAALQKDFIANASHELRTPLTSINGQSEVVFEDNGIGISEEDIHKVFEPFYRASDTISTPETGIGLHLANQIITKHQGKMNTASQPGKGSGVTIALPLSA
jgi:signal transduction histidine kinase